MGTAKIKTGATTPALTYDEILAQGSPTEDDLLLCLNGRLTRRYEAVANRIAERTADHKAAQEALKLAARAQANFNARNAAEGDPDERLTTKSPAPAVEPVDDDPYVDPEQPEADRLIAEMKRYTVPFIIRAVPDPEWNTLLEEHPPRKDPSDAKKSDPRDWEGINSSTFYADLARRSVASPPHTDEQWARLMTILTSAQFDKIIKLATDVNKRDDDLPFSRDDLESPPL
jgi:hypothetical protein